MKHALIVFLILLPLIGCTKKEPGSTEAASGWTNAQVNEVGDWHFQNVSSKMQTLSTRGDNAKKEFSKCWAQKMAREYSYSEYKKAFKEFDDYSQKGLVLNNPNDVAALGRKFPFYQRLLDFGIQCGNELNM